MKLSRSLASAVCFVILEVCISLFFVLVLETLNGLSGWTMAAISFLYVRVVSFQLLLESVFTFSAYLLLSNKAMRPRSLLPVLLTILVGVLLSILAANVYMHGNLSVKTLAISTEPLIKIGYGLIVLMSSSIAVPSVQKLLIRSAA